MNTQAAQVEHHLRARGRLIERPVERRRRLDVELAAQHERPAPAAFIEPDVERLSVVVVVV